MFISKRKFKESLREIELLKSETKRLACIIDFLNLSTSGGYPRYKKYRGKEVSNFELDIPSVMDKDDDDNDAMITEESFGKKLDILAKTVATKDDIHRIEQRLNGWDNFMEILSRFGKNPQV